MLTSYPSTRMRRLRKNDTIRSLVRENSIAVSDLVYPLFILDGNNRREEISSMLGQYRMSIDVLIKEIPKYLSLGINSLAIFPVIEQTKTKDGVQESYNPDGLIQRAIMSIKDKFPQVIIFTDVALDPYTHDGHDGITDEHEYVINDTTIDYLVKQALSHAKAGADFVCPSDMMDGRIGKIRQALEANGYHNTGIMAYSAKYASNFYGPFRDAVSAEKSLGKSGKSSYQMDIANSDEAIHEAELDLTEGADIIMIKPGLPYLDVLYRVKTKFRKPTAVYHVSGEYAMLVLGRENKLIDYDRTLLEIMLCFKRAGADIIWSYAALDVARLLSK